MKEMRLIKKSIKLYVELLENNPEEAKADKDIYAKDLDNLISFTNDIKEQVGYEFKCWCETSVAVFSIPDINIFYRIFRKVTMALVNCYLNKYSGQLCELDKMRESLEFLRRRFTQFQCILH